MDVAALVISGIAAIGTLLSVFVAVRSRKDAKSAQATAEAALLQASDALARSASAAEDSATALHRANEIAEAALPIKQPHFAVQHIRNALWAVVSNGEVGAKNVRLSGAGDSPGMIRPSESEPRDLVVGDSMQFTAIRAHGITPRLRIEWDDPFDGEHHDVEINVVG